MAQVHTWPWQSRSIAFLKATLRWEACKSRLRQQNPFTRVTHSQIDPHITKPQQSGEGRANISTVSHNELTQRPRTGLVRKLALIWRATLGIKASFQFRLAPAGGPIMYFACKSPPAFKGETRSIIDWSMWGHSTLSDLSNRLSQLTSLESGTLNFGRLRAEPPEGYYALKSSRWNWEVFWPEPFCGSVAPSSHTLFVWAILKPCQRNYVSELILDKFM